jgi:general secretion pathway protein B
MSILLDALKKSEEQRQLGKVPGIHSPAAERSLQRSMAQRFVPVILIVVSAVAMAWFGWRQFQAPESGDSPAAETARLAAEPSGTAPAAVVTAVEPPAQRQSDDSVTRPGASRRTPVEALPAESGIEPAAESAEAVQELEPRKARVNQSFTTFEAEQQAAAAPQERRAPTQAPASAAPQERRAPTQAPASAAPQDQRAPTQAPASAPAAAPVEPERQAPVASATQPVPVSQSAQADSRATKPISYWELPQGIRDSLPELRITVLVYAELPQDRFVLIGGQRLVEKEQYQEGLVLDEIRREGAVFLYRNYRFLVEG